MTTSRHYGILYHQKVPMFLGTYAPLYMKDVHVRIPKEIYKKMKVKCAYDGTSMQDYIIKLATEDLDSNTRKSSILIVDDEAIIRESLKDWLKDHYSVVTTGSGEAAIELIKQQDFDIVILDVRLTGKSGLQVLKEVKEIKPNIKSIVITAYPSVELAVEAMQEGAVDYVVKPVAAEELEKLIWKAVTKCR